MKVVLSYLKCLLFFMTDIFLKFKSDARVQNVIEKHVTCNHDLPTQA